MTGIALGTAFLLGAFVGWTAVVAIGAVGVLGLVVFRWRLAVVLLALILAIAGIARLDSSQDLSPVWTGESIGEIEGRISGHPLTTASTQRFLLDVSGE